MLRRDRRHEDHLPGHHGAQQPRRMQRLLRVIDDCAQPPLGMEHVFQRTDTLREHARRKRNDELKRFGGPARLAVRDIVLAISDL